MNDLKQLMTEILQLTTTIEVNYPELYRALDENPLTLPVSSHPEVNKKALLSYLNSLKVLLQHHIETHSFKNSESHA